jgi:tellurite resistance protein TerC
VANQLILWGGFGVFVLGMLALDLGVFHRHAHVVRVKEALCWSAVWISLALLFNIGVYFWQGPKVAKEFFTAYLVAGAKFEFAKTTLMDSQRAKPTMFVV